MNGETNLSSSNEWELSKENVQPLKQGRKVAPLTAALAPTSFDYQSKIHKEKQVFESAIRTYQGDDFLDVWYRYVLWMAETYPTGGTDMSQLLEQCITLFKDQEQYRDDERYLKIWIRYADLCADPSEILNYMYSQNMFSLQALFYESWAVVLENKGDLKRADEVYNLGIQRSAQPLERLKRQLRAFETRLAENIHLGNNIAEEDQAEVQRTALGGLKASKKGKVGAKRVGNAALPSRGGIDQAQQMSNSQGGFAVFVDENPGQAAGNLPVATGSWQEPPTNSKITRENTQKPGKWTSNKCSQRYQASTPLDSTNQKPSFTVHVDDDAPCPPCTPQTNFPGMNSVLSSRKPEKQAANDPLRNISKPADNLANPEFKVMYCKDKVYAGVEEYSLEEIRSAAIFARIRTGNWSAQPMNEEPTPNIQYKEMYPKREVYNFYEELQWEEVRAKHYFSRLAQQRNTVTSTSAARAPEVRVQSEPMDLGLTGEPSLEVSMEVTGSRTVQPDTASVLVTSQGPQARRGLSFRSPSEQGIAGTQRAAGVAVHSAPSATAPRNNLNASGAGSAFKPVQQSMSETQPPGAGLFAGHHDLNTSSSSVRDVLSSSLSRGAEVSDNQVLCRTGALTSGHATATHVTAMRSSTRAPGASFSLPAQTPTSGDAPAIHSSSITSSARAPLAASSLAPQTRLPPMRTPDKSSELNCSWLCGPSPTVNTRQAMVEVMAMFNNPLEAEHWNPNLNEVDREFEDAFDNPNEQRMGAAIVAPEANGGGLGGLGFVIYDETSSADQENQESQENMATEPENQENM